jgi:hypothetical protein
MILGGGNTFIFNIVLACIFFYILPEEIHHPMLIGKIHQFSSVGARERRRPTLLRIRLLPGKEPSHRFYHWRGSSIVSQHWNL